jgi:replicative DNA helicase
MSIIQTTQPPQGKVRRTFIKNYAEMYDKMAAKQYLPPQAIEIEQSILGAMMLDKQAMNRVLETIGPRSEDDSPFYRDAHTAIYRAAMNLDAAGEPCDLLSMTNRLRVDGQLEEIGGTPYLVECTQRCVTSANVESHSRIVLEKYIARELIRTCESMKLKAFIGEDDTFEMLDEAEGHLFRLSESRHKKNAVSMRDLAKSTMEHLMTIQEHHSGVTGVPSGLIDLDDFTGGWQKTDLIILAARPSQGKTALALTLARAAALNPDKDKCTAVAIFSLEMGSQQLTLRMLCAEAQVNMQNARKGRLNQEDLNKVVAAIDRLQKAPIFIDDTAGITPLELRAKCRRLKQTDKIGLVIVDYLQLMEPGRHFDSREREISYISRQLKALAKELDVPVIALSQLNRGVETRSASDKRPMLSDLRESGAIEQDCDLALFIYRPETYGIEQWEDDAQPTKGTAEIIIGKQRNGPIGSTRVSFRGDVGRFENLSRTLYSGY